jgi:putative DNA modification/repair radical SAM protein
VQLTLDFYRRNYIEGLFLSSGVIRSPDYTMGQLVEVARKLREDHDFRGYIHLKTIPDADGELLTAAGRHADRLSINVELPTRQALADLAPEKDHTTIRLSMARIRDRIDQSRDEEKRAPGRIHNLAPTPRVTAAFAPAGQSTQMIIGADPSTDAQILSASANLYSSYRLRRVYYSAFSPIADPSAKLPAAAPPLLREHRLYQSDWLMRFYGFRHDELTPGTQGGGAARPEAAVSTNAGMLSLDVDPKLGWALRNRAFFPIDLNRASREQLLRAPGLGARTVVKLLQMRRWQKIRLEDLVALRVNVRKALPFIICANHLPAAAEAGNERLLARFAFPRQLTLAL